MEFYTDSNYVYVVAACDIAIENYFRSLLLEDTSDRIVYSSNAYAFRKRSKNNSGNLELPFINYHLENYEPGPRPWWNAQSYTNGVYVEELEAKILCAPITLTYEASMWLHRYDDTIYAISEANFDSDNKTTLTPTVTIESQELDLTAVLSYNGNQFDPQYNEQDWLDRNKIHSITMDFTLDTFALKTNYDISLPTSVILETYAFYGDKSVIIS